MAAAVAGQEAVDLSLPQDLVVLEKNWHREFAYPGRSTNPLQANEDRQRIVEAQKRTIQRNEDRATQNPTVVEALPMPGGPLVLGPPIPMYEYQVKVKNTGSRMIKAIYWEYIFVDPDSGKIMGKHKIASKVRIAPGKTAELKAVMRSQPAPIVDINRLDEKLRDQFAEQVVIHRIEYKDGSPWKRPKPKF
jgi:hypothetical protein